MLLLRVTGQATAAVDVAEHGRHSHSGRSPGQRPQAAVTRRGFVPHADPRRCGQSGAATACMWFGAWIVPALSAVPRLGLSVRR